MGILEFQGYRFIVYMGGGMGDKDGEDFSRCGESSHFCPYIKCELEARHLG